MRGKLISGTFISLLALCLVIPYLSFWQIPTASAQTGDVGAAACAAVSDPLSELTPDSSAGISSSLPGAITPTTIVETNQSTASPVFDAQVGSSANKDLKPTLTLYRKLSTDTVSKEIKSITLGAISNGPTNVFTTPSSWSGEIKDSIPSAEISLVTYYAIINAVSSNGITNLGRCYKFGLVADGNPTDAVTKAEAKDWFNNADISGLHLTIYTDTKNNTSKGEAPKVIVPHDKLQHIVRDITYKLVSVSGEGALAVRTKKWLTFQAYIDGNAIDNMYLLISDNNDANFYYSTNFDDLKKGHTSSGDELGRITVDSTMADEIKALFDRIMNVPGTSVGSNNCGTGTDQAAKDIKVVGPKNVGLQPEPDYEKVSDFTKSTDSAILLSDNCINTATNGWLQYWGVNDLFISNPGEQCGFKDIFSLGISGAIVKVVACTVGTILSGILQPVTTGAASIAGLGDKIENRLANPNDGIVIAWKYCRSLLNILVIVGLLLIAFSNILHINVNTYSIKKSIPALVIGVIGANASILIIRVLLDVAQALVQLGLDFAKVSDVGTLVGTKFVAVLGFAAGTNPLTDIIALAAAPLTFIVIIIFVIYFIVLVILVGWTLLRRTITLFGLIIISPLAFALYGVPFWQSWFTKWWDLFIRYLFLYPVFILAIAAFCQLGLMIVNGTTDINGIVSNNTVNPGPLVSTLLVYAAATFVLKVPGMMVKALDIASKSKQAYEFAKAQPQSFFMTPAVSNRIDRWSKNENNPFIRHLGGTGKVLGAASAVAGNPEKIKEAWESKLKIAAKNRVKNFNKTGSVDLFGHLPPSIGPKDKNSKRLWWIPRAPVNELVSGREAGFVGGLDVNREDVSRINDINVLREKVQDGNFLEGLQKIAQEKSTPEHTVTIDEVMEKIISGGNSDKHEYGNMAGAKVGRSGFQTSENVLALSKLYDIIQADTNRSMQGWDIETKREMAIAELKRQLGQTTETGAPPEFDFQRANEAVEQVQRLNPTINQDQFNYLLDLKRRLDTATNVVALPNLDKASVQNAREKMQELRDETLRSFNQILIGDTTDYANMGDEAVRQKLENLIVGIQTGVNSTNANDKAKQQQLVSTLQSQHEFTTKTQQINNDATNDISVLKIAQLLRGSNEELVSGLTQELSGIFKKFTEQTNRALSPQQQSAAAQVVADRLKTVFTQSSNKRGSLSYAIKQAMSSVGTDIAASIGENTISTVNLHGAKQTETQTTSGPSSAGSPNIPNTPPAGQPPTPPTPPAGP